jgi:hypothetical protein
MQKHIYIFVASIVILSCEKKLPTVIEQKQLVLTDSLIVRPETQIYNFDDAIVTYWQNTEGGYYYQIPLKDSTLLYYLDFREDFNESIIALPINGPNGVKQIGAFHISEENIFYFPENISSVLQYNLDGKLIKEYPFNNGFSHYYSPGNSNINKVINIGEELYFPISNYFPLSDPETFRKAHLIGVLNLTSGLFREIIIYPKEFHDKVWSPNDVQRNILFTDDAIYISFSKSKYIYKYDYSGNLLKNGLMAFDEVKEAKSFRSNPNENMFQQARNGAYHTLIYSKQSRTIFRTAIFNDPSLPINSFTDLAASARNRTIGIIAFNENLERTASIKVPYRSGIREHPYFIKNSKLYFNTWNAEKRENDNSLEYYVFKIDNF